MEGRLLASVGQDDDHTVGVYDWQNKKLKATASGDKNKSLAIAFSPDGNTVCQVRARAVGVSFVGSARRSAVACHYRCNAAPMFGRNCKILLPTEGAVVAPLPKLRVVFILCILRH